MATTLAWILALAYSFAPFDASFTIERIALSVLQAEPFDREYVISLALHLLAFAVVGIVDRLGARRQDSLDSPAVPVLARGVLLCVLIEIGQIFVASRHAELVDLAVNVAGLALGNLTAGAIIRTAPVRVSVARHALRGRNALPVYFLSWGVLWSAAILVPASLVTLDSWDPTYELLVGDEKSGERAWQGELRYLAFYDEAVTAAQVLRFFDAPPIGPEDKATRLKAGLLAGYDFTQPNRSALEPEGRLKDSALRIDLPGVPAQWRWVPEEPPALLLGDGPLIRSTAAARQLSAALASGNDFSVEAWFRPTTLVQTGPARIVSISTSPFRRNVTLGQEGRALHFRVRNRLNGENGTRHELICADGVLNVFQHVVATYDRGVSTMFRNGQVMCRPMDLREPAVMLRLGTGRISGMVTALIAALSLMLAAGLTGEHASLVRLLLVGYGCLLISLAAGRLLSFPPASSLHLWFGPALVLSWVCLSRRANQDAGTAGARQ